MRKKDVYKGGEIGYDAEEKNKALTPTAVLSIKQKKVVR
jgi:hypothetical protein